MKKTKYLALARVSSREQEREGFSLEVQETALTRYAEQHGGVISRLFRIAETATKPEERETFKELLSYAKKHAAELSGLLFFKVDRAARNLFDYVELERLEADYGLPVIYITQPTENSPSGRMMRRTLANMASFYTEQQSIDVKDGLERRVQSGLFVGKAPYGYANVRRDGRGLIEVAQERGRNVRRAFELYAYHGHTLDSLGRKLHEEGLVYTAALPKFPRSKLHSILRDRAYIGEVFHQGQWFRGAHEPIVDRSTFDRVQVLLGNKVYQSHELTYGGELVVCGHCGRPVTGERKIKSTKKGPKHYVYYRCARYNTPEHPRVRVQEADLDEQVLALFDRMRIKDDGLRDWFSKAIRAKNRSDQQSSKDRIADLNRQITGLREQEERLLNLRLLEEIDASTFARKSTEIRDRVAHLGLQVDACDRGRAENGELAEKVFELSQSLTEKWLNADVRAKRQLLEIVCLNFRLDDVTLVPQMRKPFDVLAEGLLLKNSRGDRI
ncbi:MAG: recombinase family protein [Planctomycetaceae bacterium]|nr:recombinase family protein [Planctomycetaceae bacterium]